MTFQRKKSDPSIYLFTPAAILTLLFVSIYGFWYSIGILKNCFFSQPPGIGKRNILWLSGLCYCFAPKDIFALFDLPICLPREYLYRVRPIIILDINTFTASCQKYVIYFNITHNILQSTLYDKGTEENLKMSHFLSISLYIQGVDVVEWSRALDVRLSEWCCSVSMVWVQIPSKNKNLTALKSNSNTVWFNFQMYIYISKSLR